MTNERKAGPSSTKPDPGCLVPSESTYAYCAYSKCQEERACYEESEIQSTRLICSEAYESCRYSCSLMSLVSSEVMQKIKDFEKSGLQKDYSSKAFHNYTS
ncbi:hypothetical protein Tsp_00879 [Trichinella spiralis]|uniref:hypothetical protein n=1 Tax=Trichinella spiralis TaxID=6334 RepID=UPI0001EFB4AF|nr:hypothetical protein Tsp_00879 [Trichinella spiralis]